MLHTNTMIANSVSDTILFSLPRMSLTQGLNYCFHSFSPISRSDVVLDLIVEYTEWLGIWSADWDSPGLEEASTIESSLISFFLINSLHNVFQRIKIFMFNSHIKLIYNILRVQQPLSLNKIIWSTFFLQQFWKSKIVGVKKNVGV